MKRKCLLAAVLLISAFSSASAQTNWSYGDNGGAKGYYGTPHDGGPQYGSGGGGPVQLRAGPRYCYARQASSRNHWRY
jgi:hypothetical protein